MNNNNPVLVYLPLEATHRAGTTLATPPLSLIHKDYRHHHIHIRVSRQIHIYFPFFFYPKKRIIIIAFIEATKQTGAVTLNLNLSLSYVSKSEVSVSQIF